MNCTTQHSHRH